MRFLSTATLLAVVVLVATHRGAATPVANPRPMPKGDEPDEGSGGDALSTRRTRDADGSGSDADTGSDGGSGSGSDSEHNTGDAADHQPADAKQQKRVLLKTCQHLPAGFRMCLEHLSVILACGDKPKEHKVEKCRDGCSTATLLCRE